jgi:uncharacterized membrane protein YraQ (UPF0718 family)
MDTATIVLWIIAVAFGTYAWQKRDGSLKKGGKLSWKTTRQNAALLVIAFFIVGYIDLLSPTELIQTWIGPQSGWKGIFLAEGLGMLLPGGPYVVFPLIAVLYQSGASLSAVITLVTSWATLAFLTVSFELPFMGWRFTLIRWGLGLCIPLITGGVTMLITV